MHVCSLIAQKCTRRQEAEYYRTEQHRARIVLNESLEIGHHAFGIVFSEVIRAGIHCVSCRMGGARDPRSAGQSIRLLVKGRRRGLEFARGSYPIGVYLIRRQLTHVGGFPFCLPTDIGQLVRQPGGGCAWAIRIRCAVLHRCALGLLRSGATLVGRL